MYKLHELKFSLFITPFYNLENMSRSLNTLGDQYFASLRLLISNPTQIDLEQHASQLRDQIMEACGGRCTIHILYSDANELIGVQVRGTELIGAVEQNEDDISLRFEAGTTNTVTIQINQRLREQLIGADAMLYAATQTLRQAREREAHVLLAGIPTPVGQIEAAVERREARRREYLQVLDQIRTQYGCEIERTTIGVVPSYAFRRSFEIAEDLARPYLDALNRAEEILLQAATRLGVEDPPLSDFNEDETRMYRQAHQDVVAASNAIHARYPGISSISALPDSSGRFAQCRLGDNRRWTLTGTTEAEPTTAAPVEIEVPDQQLRLSGTTEPEPTTAAPVEIEVPAVTSRANESSAVSFVPPTAVNTSSISTNTSHVIALPELKSPGSRLNESVPINMTTTTTSIPTNSNTTISTDPVHAIASPEPGSSGLSTGAIVGIVAGSLAGVIFCVFAIRRFRRNKSSRASLADATASTV